MFYFKKGDSTNDTANEICIVFGSGTTTSMIICNWLRDLEMAI